VLVGLRSKTSLDITNLTHFTLRKGRHKIQSTFLYDRSGADHFGLTAFTPREATNDLRNHMYFGSLKDTIELFTHTTLSVGFGELQAQTSVYPVATTIEYQILPNGARGNYNITSFSHTSRPQFFAIGHTALDSNTLTYGVDAQRPGYDVTLDRRGYQVLREDNTIAETVSYLGGNYRRRANLITAAFIQDTWLPRTGHFRVDAGLRAEWDEISRTTIWSPRVGVTVFDSGTSTSTKLSASGGVFYDEPNLNVLSLKEEQTAVVTYYDNIGSVTRGPLYGRYSIDDRAFRTPRAYTGNIDLERRILTRFFAKVGYTLRHEVNYYTSTPQQGPATTTYLIRTDGSLSYRALDMTIRQDLRRAQWLASYVRSSAKTSTALGFGIDNPISGQQAPGPLPWDGPDRLLFRGFYTTSDSDSKLLKRLTFSENFEYHTGFPFSEITEEQALHGKPDGYRLPAYASLDMAIERRVSLFHRDWSARVMVSNVTNRLNPISVNSNIDSPLFLMYGAGQRRAYTFRLQFLNSVRKRACSKSETSSC